MDHSKVVNRARGRDGWRIKCSCGWVFWGWRWQVGKELDLRAGRIVAVTTLDNVEEYYEDHLAAAGVTQLLNDAWLSTRWFQPRRQCGNQ